MEGVREQNTGDYDPNRDYNNYNNMKRTYDEFQQESLQTVREMRLMFTKLVSDAQQYDNTRQQIANQALQNAVENANLNAKQFMRQTDLLMYGVISPVDAIAASIASKVVSAMGGTPVNTATPSTGT